jgi:hypothetical protein
VDSANAAEAATHHQFRSRKERKNACQSNPDWDHLYPMTLTAATASNASATIPVFLLRMKPPDPGIRFEGLRMKSALPSGKLRMQPENKHLGELLMINPRLSLWKQKERRAAAGTREHHTNGRLCRNGEHARAGWERETHGSAQPLELGGKTDNRVKRLGWAESERTGRR